MHEYVLEHIVSLYYRIAWWMFTELGRGEVLIAPHLFLGFFLEICLGMDPGESQNRSMKCPFSKGLLVRIVRLQQQDEYIAAI